MKNWIELYFKMTACIFSQSMLSRMGLLRALIMLMYFLILTRTMPRAAAQLLSISTLGYTIRIPRYH